MGNAWQGQQVRLRAIEPDDWTHFYTLNLDSDLSRALDYVWFPSSAEGVKKWVAEAATQSPRDDRVDLVIETLTGEFVGNIGSHSIQRTAGTFGYGISITQAQRRKGCASEAIILFLRHYFRELRYQKVTTPVYSFNDSSIRLHEKLGFTQEGRLRRMGYTNGSYYDHLMYGMTAEEFYERHGSAH